MICDIPISLQWAKNLWLAAAQVKSDLVARLEGDAGTHFGRLMASAEVKVPSPPLTTPTSV